MQHGMSSARSAPTLVLLPGLDGTGDLFRRLLGALSPRVSAQVISYPRHERLDYGQLADFVEARIAQTSPVVVLGESFSGPVAVTLAERQPARIKGLILAGTFLRSPWPRALIRTAARFYTGKVPAGPLLYFLRGAHRDDSFDREVSNVKKTLDHRTIAHRLQSVADAACEPDFNAVSCPVLILHGRQDRLVSASPIAAAASRKPDRQIELFDCAHMVLQIKPQEAAQTIQRFVERIGEA